MSQSDSAVYFSSNRESIFIPCGCGNTQDYIRIGVDDDPHEVLFVEIAFEGKNSLSARIKDVWRALRGKTNNDNMIMSYKTVVEFRDWLSERITTFDGRPN